MSINAFRWEICILPIFWALTATRSHSVSMAVCICFGKFYSIFFHFPHPQPWQTRCSGWWSLVKQDQHHWCLFMLFCCCVGREGGGGGTHQGKVQCCLSDSVRRGHQRATEVTITVNWRRTNVWFCNLCCGGGLPLLNWECLRWALRVCDGLTFPLSLAMIFVFFPVRNILFYIPLSLYFLTFSAKFSTGQIITIICFVHAT